MSKTERKARLVDFARRLTQLSQETGVVVEGAGDWPVINILHARERTGHRYELTDWNQITWERDK